MAIMWTFYFESKGDCVTPISALTNADQTWWGEADVLAVMDAEQYYNHIASAAQNGEGLHNLSTGVRENLMNLQSTTLSSWVWHKINAVLMPYGQNDESYVEPVYFGSSNKTASNQNRPVKPASSFKLYPNPAKDYLILNWDWMAEGLDNDIQISIVNLTGQVMKSETVSDYAKNVHMLETPGFVPGIYLLSITDSEGNQLFEQKVTILK